MYYCQTFYLLENVMKASDSFAILLILVALSYAVSMFVAT